MVLKRKERETEEDDFDELDEKDELPEVPKPKANAFPKLKQEHDAGDIEPVSQVIGFRIWDDEGSHYDYPAEQEALARSIARIFKALKDQ